jgi:hypothetical protein
MGKPRGRDDEMLWVGEVQQKSRGDEERERYGKAERGIMSFQVLLCRMSRDGGVLAGMGYKAELHM